MEGGAQSIADLSFALLPVVPYAGSVAVVKFVVLALLAASSYPDGSWEVVCLVIVLVDTMGWGF